jgi:FkbM family methyltransferase
MTAVSSPAPIALFAYRRPDHLARTLAALAANPEASASSLSIFCDAARDEAAAAAVERVRELAAASTGFAAVEVVLRPTNFGLARNITEGVSSLLASHDRVIVLEDDIVVSPHFLRFMNEALDLYADDSQVGSVTGYCYPVDAGLPETFFLKGADCWGWGTWRDRWRSFDRDGARLLREIDRRDLAHRFDFDGTMAYRAMLLDQIAGRNDSWAVRWHASCFLRGQHILYPGKSLVLNIGNDGTGTHSLETTSLFDGELAAAPIRLERQEAVECEMAREAFKRFFAPPAAPVDEAKPALPTVSSTPAVAAPSPPPWLSRLGKLLTRSRVEATAPPAAAPSPIALEPQERPEPQRIYRGLNELDRQIEPYLDIDGGFFVELGANDGLFQSNTWYYESQRGWRGVLVEPAPNLFLECRRNRIASTHIACAACVAFGYPNEFVRIVYSNAMSVSLGIESDLADPLAHAELGRQFLREGETVFAFGAVARPLSDILDEANAPLTIDFLSLDVEGAEIEVLKGVDHERYRFRYMLIECRDIDRLSAYLAPLGYLLLKRFNEHDYLFGAAAASR